MVELHFQNFLNKKSIDKIREEHGFRDSLPIEKFIMDFEILTHIQEVLPDCVVKGGMAVPFHLSDKKLRRLSVDIDIVTRRTRSEVIEAMKQVSAKLEGVVQIPNPHEPRRKFSKKLPLLTYFCNYQSSIDDSPELKIDILHDNNMQIQPKPIQGRTEIIGLPVDFPLSIYDHGSLIGDKLTTLPFNTIGINSDRELDVPKQIYDVAVLLKNISGDLPLELIFDAFEHISHDEISYFTNDAPTFQQVLDDLGSFPKNILRIDNQIKLNPSYQGRLEKLTTELLGKNRYRGYQHVTDILLIQLLIGLMIKKFDGINMKVIIGKANEVFKERSELDQLEKKDKIDKFKEIVAKHGKKSDAGKIINNLTSEQAFLYDKQLEIDQM